MISTIYKKKKSHQFQILKQHITSITTPLRANFITHAPSLGVRAIYTDHNCGCMHVCVCVYGCLWGCVSEVSGALCVWSWDVIVCLLPSCHPDHYDPPSAYKPFRPWEERWGSCFIEMWTEIRAVSTHLSSGQYQGPFHIFIWANLDPLL